MASNSPIPTPLTVTLSNGTDITTWGQQFNSAKICGFLEQDPIVGSQLCCISTGATDAKAICEFTWGERIGQFTDVLASVFSGVAVLSLLIYAAYRQLQKRRNRKGRAKMEIDITDSSLFLNLMIADLIQAIGNLPTARWLHKGSISQDDPVCTAQSALKQVGIVLVAATSLVCTQFPRVFVPSLIDIRAKAIAIQTFLVLILRWPIRKSHSRWIIVALWAIVALDVGIPNAIHRNAQVPYYGPTGYWCWVSPFYKTEQIATEYLWMWIAGFSMIVLYGIMCVVMLGLLVMDEGRLRLPEKAKSESRGKPSEELEAQREDREVARMMLYYPGVYLLCILPTSATRWMQFSGRPIPYQATLFAAVVFDLSGLFNTILFWFTRPELVTGGPSNQNQDPPQEDPQRTHRRDSDADSDDRGHLPDI